MEERKERVNEKTVEERIEAVENKLDVILGRDIIDKIFKQSIDV